MYTIDASTLIQPQHMEPIFQTIKAGLLRASKPEHQSRLSAITMPALREPRPLGKLLGKLLQPFRTQTAGGFEVARKIDQRSIEQILREQIANFDGLVCGIEASQESAIDLPSHSYSLKDEAIVYQYKTKKQEDSQLSRAQHIRLQGYADQSININRYTSKNGASIWLGHISSGTAEPRKFPHNREAFLEFVSGNIAVNGQRFDTTKEISFWDVNFDCTDAVNRKHNMPSSLEQLLRMSTNLPIQFIIPCVRARKQRIAARPFANNQIHKGGIEQIAESMIGTCPRETSVRAIDPDGLFVLSEGIIQHLRPNCQTQILSSIDEMEWLQYNAFSSAILLDHKPIFVQLGTQRYAFHNFMDFKGNRGITNNFWYDETLLKEEEQKFVAFLQNYIASLPNSRKNS